MPDVVAIKQSLSDLNGLLEQENIMLLSGDYAGLREIADRKTALVREVETFLAQSGPDGFDETLRRGLSVLQKLTVHNGVLLKAAYNGSRAAQARLVQIAGERSNVGAYSPTGKSIVSTEAIISRQKTV
ncbi:hypothetical protein [Aquisalinus flavus]|uniref:Uncharacterized protein n=1 Tax=Aquisalinus flavus TaxID=1526572 RepID=A0A8J2Y6N4_9PROT|nr:hypothetical protein [Aquisalinus flavus]MBD0425911.1 hypothetical protein [Aquisalinus flavus]UNE48495.1 hypothetical protein FF099_10760 [Aquisalinus flavus]GGD12300.1 hypothetical protein GCM10011342_21330 [Aquisalinus flavus]